MILFLYGPDTYRSRQKLNEIIDHYKKIHKGGLNLKHFSGQELNFQDLQDEIRQRPMFKGKKLIVLENFFSNSDFKRKFLENSGEFINSKDIILFYIVDQIPEKDSLAEFLKKRVKSQEFKPLEGPNLKDWAKEEFEKYQCRVGEKALERLVEFIGNDLWRLSNEIKKLATFKSKKKEVEEKDIEILVKSKIETDIFKTIDALAAKNKKQALNLIHKHLAKGDSPLYLLSMINFQFRNLLVVKDLIEKNKPFYLFSKMTNLHPYVIKKSYSQAQKFTIQEIKKIYQKIFEVDLNIKTGRLDPQTALDLLITEI